MRIWNNIIRFFDDNEDVDFRVKLYTAMTGVWLLINFLAQLPIYSSLWGSENLILSRVLHGPRLPMILDLLTWYPVLSPFIYFVVIVCSILMIMGRTSLFIRILTWYFVFLLDAKAWTVQDGGNNLIHLTLFYSIFFDIRFGDPDFQKFMRKFGVRAIQVQISLLYVCAFFSKVGGELWQNGTALYYIVQVDKFHSAMLMNLFQKLPVAVPVLSYTTIFIQLLLATFLWIKNWRLLPILLGTIVHLGIAASMGLISFSLVMIIHYSVFLTQDEVLSFKYFLQRNFKISLAISVVLLVVTLGIFQLISGPVKRSGYMSPEILESMMSNLKPGSRLFIVKSQAGDAEIIEKDSVRSLKESEWENIELEFGSITKLVTALKIFEEEKKGTINRNDAVLLPTTNSVSLNDLMFHTSGINDLGPDKYNVGKNKSFNYSNANYALAGQYLEKKVGKKTFEGLKHVPSKSSELINISRRPQINDFYKFAFGLISSARDLSIILKNNSLLKLPCHEDGKCWGGFKKGKRFISIGKLASGTTLGSVDQDGNFIILSSNDYTIDLEKVLELIER